MNCNRDEAGKVLVRSMNLPEYALTNLSDICDSEEAVHIGSHRPSDITISQKVAVIRTRSPSARKVRMK